MGYSQWGKKRVKYDLAAKQKQQQQSRRPSKAKKEESTQIWKKRNKAVFVHRYDCRKSQRSNKKKFLN